MNEDAAAAAIDVLINDTDVDGGPKSITAKTDGTDGTVTITGGGSGLTYQPAANFCGSDSFTYTLNGGSTATVTVTVTCVDDAPVAVDDSATILEDAGASAIDVLANDTDIDGGPKSITAVTNGANGTVATTGGGSGLTYTPAANFCGSDSFTYTLNGGSSGTVSVTVTCVNDAPSFTKGPNQTNVANQNLDGSARAYTISPWATGISPGPANEAGQAVDFVIDSVSDTSLFTVQPAVSATGALTFTTNSAGTGTATIVLHIQDNGGTANGGVDASATQSFTIQTIHPSITFVQDLGQVFTLATSGTITTTAAVAAGDSIIVFVVAGGTGPIFCSDPVNGIYRTDVQQTATFPMTAVCSKHGVLGLPSGEGITIDPGGNTFMVARAVVFSGLAATGALDRTAQAGGQSTAPAVTLGAATTQADELLVAAVGQDISASGATAFSPGTNGTANVCASTGTTTYSALPGVDGGGDIFLYPLYCVVAATGTYGASATFDTATPWSAVLATYRGTP